ncbi:MAG TPA: hypothetical protein VLX31_04250 [Streptosporangiaceae bacterium]|nr:hypothetical protein [Streptosporangiaceae bacterium]
MTSIVWANLSLAALFTAAISGIPLWMTFRHPEPEPDFTQARAYLAARGGKVSSSPAS